MSILFTVYSFIRIHPYPGRNADYPNFLELQDFITLEKRQQLIDKNDLTYSEFTANG